MKGESKHVSPDNESHKDRSYAFYDSGGQQAQRAKREAALALGDKRLNPTVRDLDYLVLRGRVSILTSWIGQLPDKPLVVLDVGGRIQPYRGLFANLDQYIAVDLVPEGLVDVIADACELPVASSSCDAVIFTQVLSYISEPRSAILEMMRVLKPGGKLILTVPAFFPQHHDEKWRFTRQGLETLLDGFGEVEIIPECHSFAGLARSLNYLLHTDIDSYRVQQLASWTTIPFINAVGRLLDRFAKNNESCTPNYCACASKPRLP